MRRIAPAHTTRSNEPTAPEVPAAGPADSMLPGRILIVDDAESSLKLLTVMLERDGHTVETTTSAEEAVELVKDMQPDLVLLDVMMPGRSGFEICRELKQRADTVLTPVVLVTALNDAQSRIRGIDAGADDFLTKPVNQPELHARVRSLLRLKRYTDDLDSAESVILSLAMTIEARDAATEGHCQRLARYAVALGHTLGLPHDDLAALRRGGFLHDVGKIAVPDAILLKPARLTSDEYQMIQQHTLVGDRLCGELRSLRRVRPIVRHHHEHCDGSGYPDGLRGDAIPLLAQIIGVVDVYDALTTARSYKPALPPQRAFDELRSEAARGWRRPELVDAFITMCARNRP